jgi:hypothetical protein
MVTSERLVSMKRNHPKTSHQMKPIIEEIPIQVPGAKSSTG